MRGVLSVGSWRVSACTAAGRARVVGDGDRYTWCAAPRWVFSRECGRLWSTRRNALE